jgi:hypothetical protein
MNWSCANYLHRDLPQSFDSLLTLAPSFFQQQGLDPHYLSTSELEQLFRVCNAVLAPTASVMGSFLAQETIKGVSRAGRPEFNAFVFHCNDYIVKGFPISRSPVTTQKLNVVSSPATVDVEDD